MTLALSLFVLFYILMLAVQQYRPWVALGGAGAFLLLGKLGVYDFTLADALADNARMREECRRWGNPYIEIDGSYESVYDDCMREPTRQGAAFGREELNYADQ